MKKNLKLFIPSVLVALSFSVPQAAQGMMGFGDEPDTPPQTQQQKQQEKFATRKSTINECINQYKVLTSPDLTLGQILLSTNALRDAYTLRLNNLTTNQNAQKQKIELILKQIKNCEDGVSNIISTIPNSGTDRRIVNQYTGPKLSSFTETDMRDTAVIFEAWGRIEKLVKGDVMKSMKIYERLYGTPYPRKDEFLKM